MRIHPALLAVAVAFIFIVVGTIILSSGDENEYQFPDGEYQFGPYEPSYVFCHGKLYTATPGIEILCTERSVRIFYHGREVK